MGGAGDDSNADRAKLLDDVQGIAGVYAFIRGYDCSDPIV